MNIASVRTVLAGEYGDVVEVGELSARIRRARVYGVAVNGFLVYTSDSVEDCEAVARRRAGRTDDLDEILGGSK